MPGAGFVLRARFLAGESLFSNLAFPVFHPVRVGQFEFGQRIHELLRSQASLVGFGHDLDDVGNAGLRCEHSQSFSPRAGATLTAVLVAEPKQTKPELSAYGRYMYDQFFVAKNGNIVACDAYIRVMLHREATDAAEAAAKKTAVEMLAAGRSKREVAEWLRQQGGMSGWNISQTVGISLKDYIDGNY